MKKETLHAVAEILGNGYKCYVNKATEEVRSAADISLEDQKSDAYQEFVPLEGEIVFGIMQDYISSIEDFEKQSELLEAISFEQPFKSFKTMVYKVGLADEWITYRIKRIVETLG